MVVWELNVSENSWFIHYLCAKSKKMWTMCDNKVRYSFEAPELIVYKHYVTIRMEDFLLKSHIS